MGCPHDRDELRARWNQGELFQFYYFYGHKPPVTGVDASCLSQWFELGFEIDGIRYPTAEHWMMAEKARLFNDQIMLERILNATSPKEAKACGRKVADFDQSVWGKNRSEIVIRGNLAKFQQNPNHQEFLLSTRFDFSHTDGNLIAVAESPQTYRVQRKLEGQSETMKTQMAETGTILVEAAPRDQIWGIGCGRNNPKAHDPNLWRGRNLLGFALTHVREKLWQDMNIESTNS